MTDRFTFVKAKISDLVNGEFVESGDASFLKAPDGRELSRVRVMGTVVEKFVAKDGNYAALTMDDSTETVRAKFFQQTMQQTANLEVGDLIDLFGFVRIYEGEIYLAPMVSKKITDLNAELVRKLELYHPPSSALTSFVGNDAAILTKVAELDKGEGVKISELIEELKIDNTAAMEVITDLMMKGELYEPKKGIIKRID